MFVKEVKEILNNKAMQNKNTNFKLLKQKGGKTRNSRKPPKYFVDFTKKMDEFFERQEENWLKQQQFNNQILTLIQKVIDRIDNIVKVNNLKE